MQLSDLTVQQRNALLDVEAWLKDPTRQVFRLFGFAGCGKTTLAKFVTEMVESYMFLAPTGKAALVLRKKGCSPTSTIHSALYRAHQNEQTGVLTFSLDLESPVKDVQLVVVDEGSMVNEDVGQDLLLMCRKILVLADPGQLPPPKGEGFFTDGANPDVLLTEIRRQEADSPVIQLATMARMGEIPKIGVYGDSRVVKAKSIGEADYETHSQILCGTNATRQFINIRYREMRGYVQENGVIPLPGERLICLRNNRERGFLNGSMWSVESAKDLGQDVECIVSPLDTEDVSARILTPIEYFEGTDGNLDWRVKKSADEFCYAYCITTHKSQGSEWPSVLVLDQSRAFKESAKNWLYTAITRASERVTLAL